MMFAAVAPSHMSRFTGRTTKFEGLEPNVQASVAPMVTSELLLLISSSIYDDHALSVLEYLRPFHDDVAACRDIDHARAFDRDILALDMNRSILVHRDAGTACLDGYRLTGIDDGIFSDL